MSVLLSDVPEEAIVRDQDLVPPTNIAALAGEQHPDLSIGIQLEPEHGTTLQLHNSELAAGCAQNTVNAAVSCHQSCQLVLHGPQRFAGHRQKLAVCT
jgi:hypothetical protein